MVNILVTGSGKYFRHAIEKTDEVFGIVQIKDGGNSYQKIWGFKGGGKPTSEFATHLTGHSIRKRQSKGREEVILLPPTRIYNFKFFNASRLFSY